jgi:hypothetical protein
MNGVKEVKKNGPAPYVANKKTGTTYAGVKERRLGRTFRNVSAETGIEREAECL